MENKRMLLVLWTTGECNLSCTYCYAAGRKGRMARETAVRAVESCRHRPLTIQFAGGEPLLNWPLVKDVTELVYGEAIDARLQLQTNGICIDREKADYIRKHKIAVGVSLDGVPEINEQLRGQTRRVTAGIRLLQEAGVPVNINAVVTSKNVAYLPKLVDFAWYLENVEGIGLDLLRAAGRGKDVFEQMCASTEQIARALWEMEERSRMLWRMSGRKIIIREVQDAVKRIRLGRRLPYCYAACGSAAAVLPDGTCYPCGSLAGLPEYCMGNLEKPENRGVALADKVPVPPGCSTEKGNGCRTDLGERCKGCPGAAVCPGACPSREILNGRADHDCALRRAAFEIAEKWYV